MMNQIIPIVERDGEWAVSARDLYAFLMEDVGSPERFAQWFERYAHYTGAKEGVDYTPKILLHPQNKQKITDFELTLDIAYKFAMVQRSKKGMEARDFFVNILGQAKAMYKQLQVAEQKQLDKEVKMMQQFLDQQAAITKVLTLLSEQQIVVNQQQVTTNQLLVAIQSQLLVLIPKAEHEKPVKLQQATLFEVPVNRTAVKTREDVINDRIGANLFTYQQMYLPHYNNVIPNDAEKVVLYAQAASAFHILVELAKEYGYGDSFFRDAIIVLRRRCIFRLPQSTRYLRDRVIEVVRGIKSVTEIVFVPRIGLQNARKY